MKANRVVFVLIALTALFCGCTHPLAVNDLHQYQNPEIVALREPLNIGIRASATELQGHRLIHSISRDLIKYNANSVHGVAETNPELDVIANIAVVTRYTGSGWNFWVDFPGFLVWAPDWQGYTFHVDYDIDVRLNDARTGKLINTVHVPVRLDVQYADISRTWTTGAGWLTLGAAPLIGGLVSMTYDDTVTPLVNQKIDPTISDYVAQQIALTLHFYKPTTTQTTPPMPGDETVGEPL